ncbi:MAG: C_GCAxxG_C_C family protein [Actinobacteria bacterium]|nr:C_GCAxxG_C_C family protein [Actinomycetota bacterium]
MTETTSLKAACPLAGGAVDEGSTCGVVSGGCLSIALGHLGDMVDGDARKGEALYGRMQEYISWFEERFGSTLCRERFGDLNTATLGGLRKCEIHTGEAASHLIRLIERPLDAGSEVTGIDERLRESGGYCAAKVMRGIRGATGHGSLYLEQLSVALDGGIGLSGGLCGALAGALMPIGLIWGLQPRAAGFIETLQFSARGHKDLHANPRKPGMWTVGNPFVREFRDRFGSLECRDIAGHSFQSGKELAEFMRGSDVCPEVKDWCRDRAIERISTKTVFSS